MTKLNSKVKYKGIYETYNLCKLLDRAEDMYSSRIVFHITNKNNDIDVTYKDFINDVKKIACHLLNQGFRSTNLMVIGDDGYEWLISLFGIIYSGNIAVPIDNKTSSKEVAELVETIDIKGVFNLSDNLEVSKKTFSREYIKSLLKGGSVITDNNYIDTLQDEKIALILPTSGTTGEKKMVMLSHKNICSSVGFCYNLVGFVEDYSNIAVLPSYHIFQIIVGYLYQFYIGGKINLINKKRLIGEINRLKPKALVLVPEVIGVLFNYVKFTIKTLNLEDDFAACLENSKELLKNGTDNRRNIFDKYIKMLGGELIMIHSGGAHLNNDYEEFFNNIGIDIFNGYGMTECAGPITGNCVKYYREGSVGNIKGTTCAEIKIEDNQILVKGPIVFKGYYNNTDFKNTFKDEWFCTGDLGIIDEDGYLFITGRIKNLIILPNGENVSPEEIEKILLQNSYIKEAQVCTKKNKLGVDVLGVIIVPNIDAFNLQSNDIYSKIHGFIDKINLTFPNYKRLKFVEIENTSVAKNEMGKLKRI